MRIYVDDKVGSTTSLSAESEHELKMLDNVLISVLGEEQQNMVSDKFGVTMERKEFEKCLNSIIACGFELLIDERVCSEDGVLQMIEEGIPIFFREE